MHFKCCIFAISNHPDTAKMAAATPISPHHDRSRGGEKSEGEESAPQRRAFGKPPHKPVYGPRPPGARPIPGTGSLKKAAWDAQANASRPKDAPGASPARPLWKGTSARTPPLERAVRNPGKKSTLTSLVIKILPGVAYRSDITQKLYICFQ